MIPEWLGNLGTSAYSWAKDNPMDLASLGVGAVGTGMGIFDQYRANKQADDRRKLAEQFSRQGPAGSMPNWSPEQLQAMYFRPASHFMAERGQTQGGAFTQALADAALKAEGDRNQIGNQWFNSRVNALGQGQPVPASGSMGAIGQALQNIQLRRALAGMPQGVGRNLTQPTAPPNAVSQYSSFYPNQEQGYDPSMTSPYQNPYVAQGSDLYHMYRYPGMGGGYGLGHLGTNVMDQTAGYGGMFGGNTGAGPGDGRFGFNAASLGGTNAGGPYDLYDQMGL